MFFRRLAVSGVVLFLVSCSQSPRRPVQRVAAIPFENQSSSSESDWVSLVIPQLVAMQAVGSPGFVTLSTPSEREWRSIRATRLLEGYYYTTSTGRLRIHAVLRDLDTDRIAREMEVEGTSTQAIVAMTEQVAAHLLGKSRGLQVAPAAVEAFGRSLRESDASLRMEWLQKAMLADPKFAQAPAAAAQWKASTGAAPEAVQILQASISQQPAGFEKSELQLLLAGITNDSNARVGALREAMQYSPQDSEFSRQLGDALVNRHQYKEGAESLKRAAELEPGFMAYWNQLAYAQAYAGDYDGAKNSLERYQKATPNDPNSSDSMGELRWYFGHFAEAEANFLEAQRKSPQFLGGFEFAKAALSRYLANDLSGADQLFLRYTESRRALRDPLVELREAHWLYMTGRKDKGMEMALKLAQEQSPASGMAESFAAFWKLQEGKQAEALESAKRAVPKSMGPQAVTQAIVVVLLAQPAASADEWRARLQKAMNPQTPPQLRSLVLAYALLLGKNYAEAGKVLEELYRLLPAGGNEEARMLLGLTKLRTGDKAGAAELLRRYPLPFTPGESMFASLYFPEFLQWRKEAGL